VSAKKATAKKATAKKATARGSSQVLSQPNPAEPGDLIVIDSPQVGSVPRESQGPRSHPGRVSVRHQVQRADGASKIAPTSGAAETSRNRREPDLEPVRDEEGFP